MSSLQQSLKFPPLRICRAAETQNNPEAEIRNNREAEPQNNPEPEIRYNPEVEIPPVSGP